jgi:Flp pilus assembly protein TadG
MPNLAHSLRRLARETRGVEIAEAAAVLPLMFMILLGIFWFGQAFSIYGAITRAAQEGARAAATSYCTTCTIPTGTTVTTLATNAVNNALTASKLDPTQVQSLSVVPIQLASTTSGTNGVNGISVSFQYPFQSWLPFTSLNKQQILLPASARVRLEDQ